MPLKGYTCPPGMPTAGNRNDVEWCLAKCPHPCVAPPLLAAMYEAEVSNHHTGAYISASMLAGNNCGRQTVFERTYDFYEHPTRRYWPFRGTHCHTIIEGAAPRIAKYGWLQEMRMQVPLVYADEPAPIFDDQGGFTGKFDENAPLTITLGGTLDAYNPKEPPYPLWDMKSTADAKAEMLIKGQKGGTYSKNLEDRWVIQTNVYRWMVSKTEIPSAIKRRLKLKGKYFPAPEFLGIQALGMMAIPRTGIPYLFKKGRQEELYHIDDVPVLPLEEIETLVRREALKWYRWLVLGEMPPVVEEERAWMCKSCPFNGELIPGERCFPNYERRDGGHIEVE